MAGPTTGNAAEGLCSLPDDPRKVALGVVVAVNLLATTLGAVQLREPVSQPHHPMRQVLQDTSKGTPLALRTAAPSLPPGVRSLSARFIPPQQFRHQGADSAVGMPRTIRAQLGTRPIGLNFNFYNPQQNRTLPADTTSADTPTALYTTVIGKPFFTAPHLAPQLNRSQPLDTSWGTPRLLLPAQTKPGFVFPHQAPIAARWAPLDTSLGTPQPLLSSILPVGEYVQQSPIAVVWQAPDTSRGGPPALLQPQGKPSFAYQHQSPIALVWQPLDTSLATPKPLYQDLLYAPTNLPENIPAIQRLDIGDDTSQSTPQTLQSAPAPVPFSADPQAYITANASQPTDTSVGTPQALIVGPQISQFRPPLYQLAKRIDWQPLDTSQGIFPGLIPAQQIPFAPATQALIDRGWWQPLDSSRGTFPGLFPALQAPFVPAIQGLIDKVSWQPLDTSRGTPDTLLGSLKPFTAAPQSYVSGAWQAPDTSQPSSAALLAPQPAPFSPAPQTFVQPHRWQGADTSYATPPALTAQPFFNYTHQQPLRAPDVVDTSRGADLPLLTFVQAPFAPVQSNAPVVNASQPLDTSSGSPLTIATAPVFKPFNMTDWPAPIEYRATWYHGFEPQTYPEFIPPAPPPPPGGAGLEYGKKRQKRYIEQRALELNRQTLQEQLAQVAKQLSPVKAKPKKETFDDDDEDDDDDLLLFL